MGQRLESNMNPNTNYELFTQEIYRQLGQAIKVNAATVQHNVKLEGKSGQKHQIDVYWEYEKDGRTLRVAIECKNYDSLVPVGKVRDFQGVLSDLNNVNGIMVSKMGFQEGAKENFNEEDFNDVEEEFKSTLKDIEDEWKE